MKDMLLKGKNDLLLILGLAVAGLVAFFIFSSNQTAGTVTVKVDTQVVFQAPLTVDQTQKITTGDGDYNVIVIKDGSVMVSQANCPDGLCVNMGTISKSGQSIICLPHKLVVSIEEDGTTDMDGVAQ